MKKFKDLQVGDNLELQVDADLVGNPIYQSYSISTVPKLLSSDKFSSDLYKCVAVHLQTGMSVELINPGDSVLLNAE